MRQQVRRTLPAAALAAGSVMLLLGCGSDGGGAAAPATTTAPPATIAPATAAPATTAPTTTAPAPVGPGDAAAGKAVFAASCDTCHAGLGTRKYVGPKLAGQGLDAALIRNRVVQGKSPMPAGLVRGQDLEDVVAFVRSIQ